MGDTERLLREYRQAKSAWELRKRHVAENVEREPFCTYFEDNYVGIGIPGPLRTEACFLQHHPAFLADNELQEDIKTHSSCSTCGDLAMSTDTAKEESHGANEEVSHNRAEATSPEHSETGRPNTAHSEKSGEIAGKRSAISLEFGERGGDANVVVSLDETEQGASMEPDQKEGAEVETGGLSGVPIIHPESKNQDQKRQPRAWWEWLRMPLR